MPAEVNVDGHVDRFGIKLIGVATRVAGSTYRCLAVVGQTICSVEITITQEKTK